MATFMLCGMNDINPGVAILLEETGKLPSIVAVSSIKSLAGFTVGVFVYACCTPLPPPTTTTHTRMWVVLHGCTCTSHLCPYTCSMAAILDKPPAGTNIQALQDSCQRLTKSVVDCLLRNHIACSVSGWNNFLSDPFKGIFPTLDSSQALKERITYKFFVLWQKVDICKKLFFSL